jgi:hypothetical protein
VSHYINVLHKLFQSACAADIRSNILRIHGKEIKGIVSVSDSGAIKPFSK